MRPLLTPPNLMDVGWAIPFLPFQNVVRLFPKNYMLVSHSTSLLFSLLYAEFDCSTSLNVKLIDFFKTSKGRLYVITRAYDLTWLAIYYCRKRLFGWAYESSLIRSIFFYLRCFPHMLKKIVIDRKACISKLPNNFPYDAACLPLISNHH